MKRIVLFLLIISLSIGAISFNACADDSLNSSSDLLKIGFYELRDSIDLSGFMMSPGELLQVFSCVLKDDPYLFFVDYTLLYSYKNGVGVVSARPTYTMNAAELEVAMDFCRGMIERIASLASAYETDAAKALFVHDYICENYGYDSTLRGDDLYEFFLSGRGTCQGYTAAYMAVMRECGIECRFVASDEIEHIWNAVLIDGEWYHVDLTWNDTANGVSRRHFMCSDEAARERGHKNWYSYADIKCNSDAYANADFDLLLHGKYESGDVDHSGAVDILDLVALLRLVNGLSEMAPCNYCSDVDSNGGVDALDVEFLRRKLLSVD